MKVVPIPGQDRVDIVLSDRNSRESTDSRVVSFVADMDIGGKFETMMEEEKNQKSIDLPENGSVIN